jgi:hypothetical protein
MTDYIVDLKTEHPDIDFGWYAIPHHSRYGTSVIDKEFLWGRGHVACSEGGPISCTYYPDVWDDGRDSASVSLLTDSQFVDGHSYGNAVLDTVQKERAYHRANLFRMKGVAAAASRPLVASRWIQCPSASESDRLFEFFEACKDLGIEEAVVLGDWSVFKQLAAQQGKDPGKYWRERVVTPAVTAGFLDSAGSNPASKLTLASVTPSFGEQGEAVEVVLQGSGFDSGTSITAGSGISISGITTAGTALEALFTISNSATLGARAVTVANSTEVFTLPDAFVVIGPNDPAPAPLIDGMCRLEVERGFVHTLGIAGEHFQDGINFTISPSSDITIGGITFVSSRLVVVTLDVAAGAAKGERAITLENPDAQSVTATLLITD